MVPAPFLSFLGLPPMRLRLEFIDEDLFNKNGSFSLVGEVDGGVVAELRGVCFAKSIHGFS